MELTHFSLCSGIGGLDLAAEWAGFRTIGQCEIDEYASKVLEKNFKGVHNFGDIRTITAESVGRYGIKAGEITVISAGMPCQPYSLAGKGLGDLDERDLEQEYMRVIGELKPRWAVIENTPGLFSRNNQRYFHRILDDFSALGYSVAWGMWGAVDVGALHKRDRIFIIAHSDSERRDCLCNDFKERRSDMYLQATSSWEKVRKYEEIDGVFGILRDTPKPYMRFARDDNGLSPGMDRLRGIGNAVVPYQAYPIFEVIAELERKGNDIR